MQRSRSALGDENITFPMPNLLFMLYYITSIIFLMIVIYNLSFLIILFFFINIHYVLFYDTNLLFLYRYLYFLNCKSFDIIPTKTVITYEYNVTNNILNNSYV